MVVLGLVVLGMVYSRYGQFWEWSVLGMVALGMVVLGLVKVPNKGVRYFELQPGAQRFRDRCLVKAVSGGHRGQSLVR
jgi:hypothetical protein